MKNVIYLIVVSSIAITIGAMERSSSDLESFKKRAEERFAEIENEGVFLENPKVDAPENEALTGLKTGVSLEIKPKLLGAKANKTLSELTKELHKLGILVNLDAKSEKEIFSFTDKLIQKGPGSAKLVRKMIQEYARNKNNPNWEKYTYKRFKLDVVDKVINEKAEVLKKTYPMSLDHRKFYFARNLKAYLWSRNEAKTNLDYQELLNYETLRNINNNRQDELVEGIKLGANSFAIMKIDELGHQKLEPLIIRAVTRSDILEAIFNYDDNYDSIVLTAAIRKLQGLRRINEINDYIYLQALNMLNMIDKKFSKKLKNSWFENIISKVSNDLSDKYFVTNEWQEEKLEDLMQRSQELQVQAKQFEKKPSSSNITPSKGWFSGLSEWWYGSGKEEKK